MLSTILHILAIWTVASFALAGVIAIPSWLHSLPDDDYPLARNGWGR